MDDTFASSWEHLEELRQVLIKSLMAVLVGMAICLFFFQSLFDWMAAPLNFHEIEKETIYKEKLTNKASSPLLYKLPYQVQLKENAGVRQLIIEPGQSIEVELVSKPHALAIFSPLEGLLVSWKLSFLGGILVSSPIWLFYCLRFIFPGLHSAEIQWAAPFIISSFIAIFGGIFIAHDWVLPLANTYLSEFNISLGRNLWSVSEYVHFCLLAAFGSILLCEFGILLLILVHLNILTAEMLIAKRRYMAVISFILGALLTPPDVLTQLLFACPLLFLYEAIILYGRLFRQKTLS